MSDGRHTPIPMLDVDWKAKGCTGCAQAEIPIWLTPGLKTKNPAEAGFFWCGREDSNFHGLPH
ncbi:hypothetical protein, partial [Ensifer sp. ZNC0028]|uniref:hypothetical protein n=1 Tax=Ensifer sp. ZNC0028 TaxID=1339236 RepID=UPI001AEC0107